MWWANCGSDMDKKTYFLFSRSWFPISFNLICSSPVAGQEIDTREQAARSSRRKAKDGPLARVGTQVREGCDLVSNQRSTSAAHNQQWQRADSF
jgi:hypothetical protein